MNEHGKTLAFTAKTATLLCVFLCLLTLCSCLGSSEPCEHIYTDQYLRAIDGHYAVCDLCGKDGEFTVHAFGEFITEKTPTDTEDGSGYRECAACRYVAVETIHTYVKVEARDSTCGSLGTKEHYRCSSCGSTFDMEYNQAQKNDLLIALKSHSFSLCDVEITAEPTISTKGRAVLRCDSYEICRHTVYLPLPVLTDTSVYSVVSESDGITVYDLKESYVTEQLQDSVRNSELLARVVDAVTEEVFTFVPCNVYGHEYTPTSFVSEDNELYYLCERNPSHRIDIALPEINDEDYVKGSRRLATCTWVSGYRYSLNMSWSELLREYESELVCGDYTLSQYASALNTGVEFFLPDEGGTTDPDNHKYSDVEILSFVAPYYDVHTREYTEGTAVCYCLDCETEFTEVVEYSDGVWRNEGSAMFPKYYRDYRVFDDTLSVYVGDKFKYRIDLNGGTAADGIELCEDISGVGFITLMYKNYTREGYYLMDVSINVDRGTRTVEKGRVEYGENFLHGEYCKINMGGEYLGDIIITLQWHAK